MNVTVHGDNLPINKIAPYFYSQSLSLEKEFILLYLH